MNDFIAGRIVIKTQEPYEIHQPIFGHKFPEKPKRSKNRKHDGWVNAVKNAISRL